MDPLNASGTFKGSLGAPPSKQRLDPGPTQLMRPVRAGAVRPGQQLGDAALKLIRGTFQRSTPATVSRLGPIGTRAQLATNSSGVPPAPSVTGWDGVPLDQYGVRDPDGYLLDPVKGTEPVKKRMTARELVIAWLMPGVPPPGPLG